MANTIVEVLGNTGLTSNGDTLTLLLYDLSAVDPDAVVNVTPTDGDACTEATNRLGLYTAVVADALTGIHFAHAVDDNGLPMAKGYVYLEDDTETHRVGSYVDALLEAAMSEAGAPPATPSPLTALMTIYMALRNKLDITTTTKEFHNDAGSVVWQKALSDDGTTYVESEGAAP